MSKSIVAVLKTNPESVLEDYQRLMELVGYEKYLPKAYETVLKINISWHLYFPACSTTPWQLEGVARTLRKGGYNRLIAGHNSTVVVDAHTGEVNNHLLSVRKKYALQPIFLNDPVVEWIRYEPKGKMLVLDKVYPEGIFIPQVMMGKNVVHLPTIKTHVFTTMTGAMKNAFGGLLGYQRHWTHSVIHETLVDLLTIQKEIHPGIFAVMDGTIAGEGPGPRAMRPHVKNYILASGDSVALDAIAAKMMGFDPLSLKFLTLAQEKGLGSADPREIEVLGDDVSELNFHFAQTDTLASRGQKLIYHGFLKKWENFLLRSPLVPWSYLASRIYHDLFWYPFVGETRVRRILRSEWGRLFASYG